MSRRAVRRGRSGGVQVFTPRSLSGLVAWYRADQGITIATGVSQWNNIITGDANTNLAQATGFAQPTRNATDAAYNNQSTLSFASAALQQLQSGTWATPVAQAYTWFVVGNDDGTATVQVYLEGDVNGLNRSILYQDGAGYQQFAGSSLTGGTRGNSPRILMGVGNGASSELYISAKTAVATGASGANGIAGLCVGSTASPNAWLNGKVAEAGVYSRALSASERAALWTYLGTRYGITVGA